MPGTPVRGPAAARQAWHGTPRMMRSSAAVLLATVALTAAACGSSGGSSGNSGSGAKTAAIVATYPGVSEDASLHSAVPSQYRTNGVKVAVFNDWPPDEFLQNGQLTGWSVDLAHAMAALLNVKFTYYPTSFDAILPGI